MTTHTRETLTAFEDRIRSLWEAGELPCLLHLCGGNEGQLLDVFKGAMEGDWTFSTHRNHYHALLAGIPELELEQSIRDGHSMFTFSARHRFFSSSILAGNACVAAGVAWALKAEGSPNRVLCFIGDGAVEQGHFWEAICFVEANDLPCVFVVEDNLHQVDTPKNVRRNGSDALDRALATFKCVRRYEYVRTYPHAGSGCKFQITFKPEAIERMKGNQ